MNGWDVVKIDEKTGDDIWDVADNIIRIKSENNLFRANGILAAPPCTHASGSGAHKWKEKDSMPSMFDGAWPIPVDSITDETICLIMVTLLIVELTNPDFWALENPVGRLNRLVPELKKYGPWYFQPSDFGDPYTKKTGLWGVFNKPQSNPVLPLFGSIMTDKLSSYHEKKHGLRSATSKGFARAFYEANH